MSNVFGGFYEDATAYDVVIAHNKLVIYVTAPKHVQYE